MGRKIELGAAWGRGKWKAKEVGFCEGRSRVGGFGEAEGRERPG